MAVTSIWPVKGRAEKVIDYIANPAKTNEVADILEYAKNAAKTEQCRYVSCLNCELEYAAEQFAETKRLWRKTNGRSCYHGYQSFAAGEVTAEQAHQIGVQLARELWGDRFEVVVATHLNTVNLHNHFVLNAVSFADGKKFANSRADYRKMREVSDRLVSELGLSVVESSGRGKHYAEWQSERLGKPTVRGLIRADIDRAIAGATTESEFVRILAEMGYELKTHGKSGVELKYPAVKPPGGKGYFRLHKLGKGYSLEDIRAKILANIERKPAFVTVQTTKPLPTLKANGLAVVYRRYCAMLHIWQIQPKSVRRVSAAIREDVLRLDKLDEETQLLGRNNIRTDEDLAAYMAGLKEEIDSLKAERKGNTDENKVSEISNKLKKLRREVRLCKDIAERSGVVEQRLGELVGEQDEVKQEVRKNELCRGRGGAGRADELGGNGGGGEDCR